MSPQTNVYICDKTADHGKGKPIAEMPLCGHCRRMTERAAR